MDDRVIYRNTVWEKVTFTIQCLIFLGLVAMVGIVSSQRAHADTYVETSSGWAFKIPEGWSFQAVPNGFNTAPFDAETNPFGMKQGQFPLYNLYLSTLNCHPGELVISPSACPPQPEVIEPLGCYTYSEPPVEPPVPVVCKEDEVVMDNVCVDIKPPKCDKQHRHDEKCRQ